MKSFHFGVAFAVLKGFLCGYRPKLMYQNQQADTDDVRTVTLTRKDLLAARRLLQMLSGSEERPEQELRVDPLPRPISDKERTPLIARAHDEIRNRRRRIAVFGNSMFGEAAWDMLVLLYVLDVSGERLTIGNLVRQAGTAPTTAYRWLTFLASHDLISREPHPTDLRTEFILLTPKARELLDVYYSGTVRTDV